MDDEEEEDLAWCDVRVQLPASSCVCYYDKLQYFGEGMQRRHDPPTTDIQHERSAAGDWHIARDSLYWRIGNVFCFLLRASTERRSPPNQSLQAHVRPWSPAHQPNRIIKWPRQSEPPGTSFLSFLGSAKLAHFLKTPSSNPARLHKCLRQGSSSECVKKILHMLRGGETWERRLPAMTCSRCLKLKLWILVCTVKVYATIRTLHLKQVANSRL